MGPELRVNYPLYALSWLGIGELLWRSACWLRRDKAFGSLKDITMWVLSAAAAASLPIAFVVSEGHSFLAGDLLSTRLTNLQDGVVAESVSAWYARDGLTGAIGATCLPLVLLGPAAWLLSSSRTGAAHRNALAIPIGPALVLLTLAIHQIRWWNTVDGALLALLVASAAAVTAATDSRLARWLLLGLAGVALMPGFFQLLPPKHTGSPNDFKFTRAEIEGLYERALAQWIADLLRPGRSNRPRAALSHLELFASMADCAA